MTVNKMRWLFVKLLLLCISVFTGVTIGESAAVSTTRSSASGSFLSNATVSTQPPGLSGMDAGNSHLNCARKSLVGPDYNRMFTPLLSSMNLEQKRGTLRASPTTKEPSQSRAVNIRIILNILRIMDVDEHKGLVRLLIIFKQFWTDGRIEMPPEYMDECPNIQRLNNGPATYLPLETMKTIWYPDLYINRMDQIQVSKILVKSEAVRINDRGAVEYTIFGKFKLFCEMDFRTFPMDVQYCPMYVESWRLLTFYQRMIWDPKHPIGQLHDYKIDQFSFSVKVLRVRNITYYAGHFSRIGVMLIFSRKLQFYLLQIYFPTVLFVIISWLTFFIPPPYAQGRIILTITTMLTLSALNSLVSKHSPSVSYLRAIDVWMLVCFLFAFVAVVDCLVDIRLLFVISQSYKQQKLSFLTPVSVALVENRQVFDDLFGADGGAEPEATPSVYCDAAAPPAAPGSSDGTIQRADSDAGRDRSKQRVSFAAEPTASVTRGSDSSRLQPRPLRVESAALQVPDEADGGPRLQLERGAVLFEKLSIIVYPVSFVLFNVCYWAYYLHASHPPAALAEELRNGFTPEVSHKLYMPPGMSP